MNTTTEVPMQIALPEPVALAADPAPESNDSGVNWADEAGEQGDVTNEDIVEAVEGNLEVITPPVTTEAPKTEAPVAPVTQAPVVAPAPVTPAVEAQPVVAPTIQPTPAPTPSEPFDYAAWEKKELSNLESMYAINAADAEKLNTEPELILPKLAANMHMMVTKSIMTAMQGMIPEFVMNHSQAQRVDQEARSAFYGANPDLSDPKFEPAVLQVAKIFRAANPTAPREVAIKTIGDMVRMSLNLSAPAQTPAPTTQAAPVAVQPSTQPFTPARGGGGGQAQVKSANPWDEFSNRDD